jgi:hypothetical protein
MEFVYQGLLFATSQFLTWVVDRLVAIDPNLKVMEKRRMGITRFTFFGMEARLVAVRALLSGVVYATGQTFLAASLPLWATFLVGLMFGVFVAAIGRALPLVWRRLENGEQPSATYVRAFQFFYYSYLPAVFLLPLLANALQSKQL